jgi:hypothetical protein
MKTKTTKDPEQYFERRDELDLAAAEQIRSGKAKRVPPGMSVADRVARLQQESRPVTIRLRLSDIEIAKSQAERKGLGYQTYLKSLLHQALLKEE